MASHRDDHIFDLRGPSLHPLRIRISMHDDVDVAAENIIGKTVSPLG